MARKLEMQVVVGDDVQVLEVDSDPLHMGDPGVEIFAEAFQAPVDLQELAWLASRWLQLLIIATKSTQVHINSGLDEDGIPVIQINRQEIDTNVKSN